MSNESQLPNSAHSYTEGADVREKKIGDLPREEQVKYFEAHLSPFIRYGYNQALIDFQTFWLEQKVELDLLVLVNEKIREMQTSKKQVDWDTLRIVTNNQWVDVNESLPKLGEEVNIVWDLKDGQPPVSSVAEYDATRKIFFDVTYPDGIPNVLFWQHLPPPPTLKSTQHD